MSNVIKNHEDLQILLEFKEELLKKGIVEDIYVRLFDFLLPKEDNGLYLVNYVFSDSFSGSLASFNPRTSCINLNLQAINKWLEKSVNDFHDKYPNVNLSELRIILFLLILIHEVEHSYQFLMGNEKIAAPYQIVREAYSGIYDLFQKPKYYNVPLVGDIMKMRKNISFYLYYFQRNMLLLERNADLEAWDTVFKLAKTENNKDLEIMALDFYDTLKTIGYLKNSKGSIEETYRKVLLYHKYRDFCKDEFIPIEDRVRYGLPIDEIERKKVLSIRK